jgi:hypothetical protein
MSVHMMQNNRKVNNNLPRPETLLVLHYEKLFDI